MISYDFPMDAIQLTFSGNPLDATPNPKNLSAKLREPFRDAPPRTSNKGTYRGSIGGEK